MNWTRIRWEGDTLDIHALAMQGKKGKGAEQQILPRSRSACDVCDREAYGCRTEVMQHACPQNRRHTEI